MKDMKKLILLIVCILCLSLSCCTSGAKYNIHDISNAVETTLSISTEAMTDREMEWFDVSNAKGIKASGYVYTDDRVYNLGFNSMDIVVFRSSKKAEAFFERYSNEELNYISLIRSGENFCLVSDHSFCDAVGRSYVYIKDNAVFMVNTVLGAGLLSEEESEAESEANKKTAESFDTFIEQDFPKIIEALG